MHMTQHNVARCRIYLHPTACTSRASIEAIQRRTGLLVIITTKERIALVAQPAQTTSSFGGTAA